MSRASLATRRAQQTRATWLHITTQCMRAYNNYMQGIRRISRARRQRIICILSTYICSNSDHQTTLCMFDKNDRFDVCDMLK